MRCYYHQPLTALLASQYRIISAKPSVKRTEDSLSVQSACFMLPSMKEYEHTKVVFLSLDETNVALLFTIMPKHNFQ